MTLLVFATKLTPSLLYMVHTCCLPFYTSCTFIMQHTQPSMVHSSRHAEIDYSINTATVESVFSVIIIRYAF